ncbi:MAG: hypothetical protein ACHQK8_08230, partial [Bacteroidia bacterium]
MDSINSYYQSQGLISINILNFGYDKIHFEALDNGYVQYNNSTDSLLINGPDTSHSPFVGFNVFSSAPWYVFHSGLTARYVFPSSLFTSNLNNTITKIEFKTEGTDWQTVLNGEVIEVNYEDTGLKWGSVKITLQDENMRPVVLQSGFKIFFGKKGDSPVPDEMVYITAAPINGSVLDLPFTQVCETESGYSPYGNLRYYIKYASQDHVLRKPFIFVEGIDFDYKDYLATQGNYRYGEFGWDVFMTGGKYPNGYPDFVQSGSIYSEGLELLVKESNGGNNGLINQLLSQGYDIILVDFARGADYIQKNAYALVKAIIDINNKKIGPEENVIVGASMGGLVVRYALAYMEKHNIPHCTRLYVSFDVPHLGSNVPIGLQYGCLFFAETNNDKSIENVRRLNLPASKQMLLRHFNRRLVNGSESESFAPCFRENLVNALAEIGWPENLRKIAIANGNISGIGNGISNGDQLIDWVYNKWFNFSVGSYNFLAAQAKLYAQGRPDNLVFTGTYTSGTSSKVSSGVGFGSGITLNEVSGGNISLTVRSMIVLGVYVSYHFDILRYTKNYYFDCGGNNCANLDGAPGGQHNGISILRDGIAEAASKQDGAPQPTYPKGQGIASFIPATSALALTNPPNYNGNYFYNIRTNIFPNTDNVDISFSHFEAIKGPENIFPNEGHIYLKDDNWYVNKNYSAGLTNYKGNTNWLVNQLKINTYDLTTTIPSINGNQYNFDRNQCRLRTININMGGTLQVNGNYFTHWADPLTDAIQPPGSTVTVSMPICASSTISINNGGTIILGDNNTLNNKGILDIKSNSVLNLNNGSTLTIYNNSKLIIESGAILNVSGTATINLNGSNAVIEIQNGGILNVSSGATLSYTGGGFIRFIGGNGSQSAISGSGQLNLNGPDNSSSVQPSHKILEFASSVAGNKVDLGGNISSFNISDGLISSNCEVDFKMPVSVSHVKFNDGNIYCLSNTNNFYATNSIFNSNFNCIGNDVFITGCESSDAFTVTNSASTNIYNSKFTMGDNALRLINSTADLSNDQFRDNYVSLKAENSGNITCRNCIIDFTPENGNNNVLTGIDFSGNSTSSLNLEKTDILNMYKTGVRIQNGNLFARCGSILNNTAQNGSAIELKTDAVLTLDPGMTSPFTSGYLGNMDLSGYNTCINATNASDIYIDNAASNLETHYFYRMGGGYYGNALNGNLTSSHILQFGVQGNYWSGGHAPVQSADWPNFWDANGWLYDLRVNSSGYLTSPPNITYACPDIATGGGGNNFGKTGNTHTSPIFEKADSIPFENGHNLK